MNIELIIKGPPVTINAFIQRYWMFGVTGNYISLQHFAFTFLPFCWLELCKKGNVRFMNRKFLKSTGRLKGWHYQQCLKYLP